MSPIFRIEKTMEERGGTRVGTVVAEPVGGNSAESMLANTPPATPRGDHTNLPVNRGRSNSSLPDEGPPYKKFKSTPMKTPRPGGIDGVHETPKFASKGTGDYDHLDEDGLTRRYQGDDESSHDEDPTLPMTRVPHVFRRRSISSSSPSDLSHSSRRDGSSSPGTPYVPEVPPAPPSTPASDFKSILSSSQMDDMSSPLPYAAVKNAAQLERQQQFADGAATPAPTKRAATRTEAHESSRSMIDDFTGWVVGDRYKLVRMLGRGSYGEVAQALDLHRGKASVAIKRIQSPFDQVVDAVRLFREIHILRRLKGHECVIDLLDVVQPPSDNLEEFNDLYLVFECKYGPSCFRTGDQFLF